MTKHIKQILTNYILSQTGEQLVSFEENAGSLWLTGESGKVYSIMVIETEPIEKEAEDE
jgi:hypothetical protein